MVRPDRVPAEHGRGANMLTKQQTDRVTQKKEHRVAVVVAVREQ